MSDQATSVAKDKMDFSHHVTSVDQSDRKVPINLRQSGATPVEMLISTRVRKSPYWHLSHEAGLLAGHRLQPRLSSTRLCAAGRRRRDG